MVNGQWKGRPHSPPLTGCASELIDRNFASVTATVGGPSMLEADSGDNTADRPGPQQNKTNQIIPNHRLLWNRPSLYENIYSAAVYQCQRTYTNII